MYSKILTKLEDAGLTAHKHEKGGYIEVFYHDSDAFIGRIAMDDKKVYFIDVGDVFVHNDFEAKQIMTLMKTIKPYLH